MLECDAWGEKRKQRKKNESKHEAERGETEVEKVRLQSVYIPWVRDFLLRLELSFGLAAPAVVALAGMTVGCAGSGDGTKRCSSQVQRGNFRYRWCVTGIEARMGVGR